MAYGIAYGDLPFPDTACPEPDVCIYHVSDMIDVLDTVATFHTGRSSLAMTGSNFP